MTLISFLVVLLVLVSIDTVNMGAGLLSLCPAYLLIPDHRIHVNLKALWGVDPHPSKSKLKTGVEQVKLHCFLIRNGPDQTVVRGNSKYGTPVAIQDMLHKSATTNLTTMATPTTTPMPTTSASTSTRTFLLSGGGCYRALVSRWCWYCPHAFICVFGPYCICIQRCTKSTPDVPKMQQQ
jgi:hypothetical protein